MLTSMTIFNIDTGLKLSNPISDLFYTIIYTILHITHDNIVTVLRNKARKFRFYMYPKEELYMLTFYAQYLIYFLLLNFLWLRLNRRISQKITSRGKILLYGIIINIDLSNNDSLWNAVTVLCGQLDCDDDTS